ncbi:taurine catabolism dioxygenase TauD [Ilyonectria robusta]
MNFSRRILTGAPASPRSPMIPPITEAQAEALDAVHFTALKHQLSIPLQEGDIRFINNHAVLHGRDAFDDSDQSQRHLVRLWLRNPDKAWRMPTGLNMAWDRVYRDLGLEGDDESWPLMPVISEKRLMNRQASCGQG